MIKVICDVEDRGWFAFRISDASNAIEIRASSLSDSPSTLISSMRTVVDGAGPSSCSFQVEPGEYRLFFLKSRERVHIKVIHFAETFSRESDTEGRLAFEGTDNLYRLAKRIKRQYDRLLYHYGLEGYRAAWGHDFPLQELERLEESIGRLQA